MSDRQKPYVPILGESLYAESQFLACDPRPMSAISGR
jgi:hypothetical protein